MCYHYSLSISSEELIKRYSAFDEDYALLQELYGEIHYYLNGFSHPLVPVVVHEKQDRLKLSRWGLIPSWTRSREDALEIANKTLNARSESVFEKASFRESILKRRCLVPATGFFEWQAVKGKKYPHFISLKSEKIFSFAGLYDEWVDRSSGEIVHSFSLLTTEANPLMAKIHNTKKRMPLILPSEKEKLWLDETLSRETLTQLFAAYDENDMSAYTISRLVSSGEEKDTPAVLAAHTYPELQTQQGELF
ncbi:MAG TPA: SOS response-associated peptidase [Bacteroidia bacterium]|nr:SOS response-associated peptidase [Bacteroidia bacterium]